MGKDRTYIAEFFERDLPIKVLISLNNSSVHQLLQLDIVEVISNHHFQNGEKLSVRYESVVVYVINLKSKSQLFFLGGARGQRV